MVRTALDIKDRVALESGYRLSDEMKQQLALMKSTQTELEQKPHPDLKIVTFDSDLEKAIPDLIVMWEKSSCC